MIGTDITGATKDNLSDLLNIVADPKAYSEKMQALQNAIAENKKYVELVAPASDIIKLRNDTRNLVAQVQSQADETKAAAEAEANKIVAEAKAKSEEIVSSATSEAERIKASVSGMESNAQEFLADAKRQLDAAAKSQERLDTEIKRYQSLISHAEAEKKAIEQEKEKYQSMVAEISAKHQAFIESLK